MSGTRPCRLIISRRGKGRREKRRIKELEDFPPPLSPPTNYQTEGSGARLATCVQRFSKFLQHPVARARTVPSNQIAEGFKFCSLIGSRGWRCWNRKLQELGKALYVMGLCKTWTGLGWTDQNSFMYTPRLQQLVPSSTSSCFLAVEPLRHRLLDFREVKGHVHI